MEKYSQIFAENVVTHKRYRASNRSERMAKISLETSKLNSR